MGSINGVYFDEERITITLPSSVAVITGRNQEGDWLSNVEAVTTDVEDGEVKTFGSNVKGGNERATREEMIEQLVRWFRHEVEEQLGLQPEHYDGPDDD